MLLLKFYWHHHISLVHHNLTSVSITDNHYYLPFAIDSIISSSFVYDIIECNFIIAFYFELIVSILHVLHCVGLGVVGFSSTHGFVLTP